MTIEKKTFYIAGRTQLNLIVEEKVSIMKEVVVNKGYYSERKKLSTGNSVTIKAADIMKTPSNNPILALQGRVPGLYIETNSGLPGATQQVNIRGYNSIKNGTQPLYIVNGVPYNTNSLSVVASFQGTGSALAGGVSPLVAINPNDIEEITVLKDADATAIYGSRGANGVILITTKSAKAGKLTTNVDYSTSLGFYPKFLKMLNTEQYLEVRNEAFRNDGQAPGFSDYDVNGTWDKNKYTDWQKELLGGTSQTNNLQVSMNGGNESTKFAMSAGYRNQTLGYSFSDGMGDKTLSIRSSINHISLNKKFEVTLDLGYTIDKNILPESDLTGAALSLAPNAPDLFNPDGTLNWENGTFENPLGGLKKTVESKTANLLGSLGLNYKILPDLQLRTNLSYTKQHMDELGLAPGTAISPTSFFGLRSSSVGKSDVDSWIVEPQLNYGKSFGAGRFSALVGTTFQQTMSSGFGFKAEGFPSDSQLENFSIATSKEFFGQTYSDYHYTAFFGRLNYTYDSKYIINVTGRRDGSSRFGPDKRFGNFGSIGVSWVFSEENFLNTSSWLTLGKIRANYGTTGNDNISEYNFLGTYRYYSGTAYGGVAGLVPSILANSETSWEINKKLNLGIDLGFVQDRINLSVDWFKNRSGNQLVYSSIPAIAGFTTVIENLPAVIENQGIEAVLNTSNINSKNFKWNSSFNIGTIKNKLVSFPGLETSAYKNYLVVGESLNVRALYHYTGVNPLTGLYTVEDVNKDGQINLDDNVSRKSLQTDYSGGFNNRFAYKDLELNVFFLFVKKTGESYLSAFGSTGGANNRPVEVLDRWKNPGDNSPNQRYSAGGSTASQASSNYSMSDATIVDASYIRLKNVSLSYNMPETWIRKVNINSVQFYLTADNLFVWTPYLGPDPETGGRSLPPMRTITFGVRASL
jgi:TonB-linked SusC/RagA family outer membrane protein